MRDFISCLKFLFQVTLFLVAIAVFSGCETQQRSIRKFETAERKLKKEKKDQEWSIVKVDKNTPPTWTIYTRKIAATNFLEYKIEGEIKASPKACVFSFKQDIYIQADDPKNKKYPTYEILDESKEGFLTYVIHNEPFPFKDTEMSVRYFSFQDTKSTMEEIKWKEAWDEDTVPSPSKKLSRVETFRGSWQFTSLSNSHCKAVNNVQFDPKKMPHGLVNKMVVKFLVEGLENIRGMTGG